MLELTPIADGLAAGTWPARLLYGADGFGLVDPGTYLRCIAAQHELSRWFTGQRIQIWEPPHPAALTADDIAAIIPDDDAFTPTAFRNASLNAPAPDVAVLRLGSRARLGNVQIGRRLVDGIAQSLQYREGDSMPWHTDRGNTPTHKHIEVSVIAQLSDGDEYEGGSVELDDGGTIITLPRARGSVAVFPSEVLHRVTTVTAGCRRSITGFFASEQFTAPADCPTLDSDS